MKIFVTGCAGLLGSNYARHLISNGHEVIGIDNLSGGYKAFVPKGEKFTFACFPFSFSKNSTVDNNLS